MSGVLGFVLRPFEVRVGGKRVGVLLWIIAVTSQLGVVSVRISQYSAKGFTNCCLSFGQEDFRSLYAMHFWFCLV